MIISESLEEENGLMFNVIRADVDYGYNVNEYVRPNFCKVILKIDKTTTRTLYFKNGIETSKEIILQDERIKSLRR